MNKKRTPMMTTRLAAVVALLLMLGSGGRVHALTVAEQSTRYWAAVYNLSGDYMWAIALCESSGSPDAVGPWSSEGAPVGLFQIKQQTWNALQAQELADTALAPNLSTYDPVWGGPGDAEAAAHLAAWAWAHNYGGLWACRWTISG